MSSRSEMMQSFTNELRLQRRYLAGEPIETIYFGGGTPSLLSGHEIETLIKEVKSIFVVNSQAEVTLEANPDDLTESKLTDFLEAGVNRLSIGIQSFNNDILRFFNRAHNSAEAIQSVATCRTAGFQNISIDLIYAVPGQPETEWIKNIQQAVALNPEHISAYNLTIEPQTAFGNWSTKGKLSAVNDDDAASQLEILVDILIDAGYQQYEVSNFAKAGFESKHNSSYWQRKSYLGIGPSAHSYNKESRQYNVKNNQRYIKALLTDGIVPFQKETLTREDHINEYLLTCLRTHWGADLSTLLRDYDYDLVQHHQIYVKTLLNAGLATLEEGFLKLTRKGWMMADKISSDLFLIS